MCGLGYITDLSGETNVAPIAVKIAKGLQHRGELGMGIATLRTMLSVPLSGHGLVDEVITPARLPELTGHTALVHTRYATSGVRSESFTQPFGHMSSDPHKRFIFGFNGNIANFKDERDRLLAAGVDMGRQVDTELLLQLMIQAVNTTTRFNMAEMFTMLEERLDGAYTIGWVNEAGEAGIYRGANGIKPMSFVAQGDLLAAASEDSALTSALPSCKPIDLEPGQLLHVQNGKYWIEQIQTTVRHRCFFESVYFAAAPSKIDGNSVYGNRFETGRELAKKEVLTFTNAVVVPVPSTANSAADGYACESPWPLTTGLTKNSKVGRTFIASEISREQKVKDKYKIHPSLMEGKDVILVDDSVVRGTTMRILAKQIRAKAKPSSIHLRIACPPILAPCFYGIDFPTCSQLIARKYAGRDLQTGCLPDDVLASIATDLGVDSIQYLPVESAAQILDPEKEGLCMACVTGKYPTAKGQELYQLQSAVQ